jgi:hypothetical protein
MRFGMSMKVKGFILLLKTKIEAERYARELFPEESEDSRYARIYCKSVVGGCVMNWLKDFFFCNTWREFFVLAVLASMGFIVFWALLVFVFVLFG